MCLDYMAVIDIANVIKHRKIGYKVFSKHKSGHLYPVWNYFFKHSSKRIPVRKFINDSSGEYLSFKFVPAVKYYTGFHIFTNIEDCKTFIKMYQLDVSKMSIRKVEYDSVNLVGIQNGMVVVVARQIKILPGKNLIQKDSK